MRHDHRPLLKTPTHACVRVLLFLLLLWWTSHLHVVSFFCNQQFSIHPSCLCSRLPKVCPLPRCLVVLAWSINAPHTSDMVVVVLNPWCLWGLELLNYQGCSPLDRGCSWRVQKVFAWSSDAAPPIVPFLSSGIHICSWIGRVQKNQKTGLRRVQNRSFSLFQVFFLCVLLK